MQILGTGIYSLNQAARLVGEEPRALRRWLRGYAWTYKGEQVHSAPLWQTQLLGEDVPEDVIGFRDLLELRMVSAFIHHGVSLKVIRATVEAASSDFGQAYPLTNQKFLTDGKRIFLEAIEHATGEPHLLDVLHKQFVFSDIIKPSLYASIDYANESAVRWFPLGRRKSVVLDPALQFGSPIISHTGVPTDTIYAAYLAEGRDKGMVARVFDLTPRMVNDAIEFEEGLAA